MSNFEIGGKPKFLVIGAIAMVLLGFQINAFFLSQAAMNWPTVKGRISSSHVKTSRGGRRGNINKRAVVEYRYTVRGKQYTNDRVRVTDGSSAFRITQWNAQGIVERYGDGKRVDVAYDPEDPSNAVLETQLPISSYLWIFGSITVLLVCGIGVIRG